MAKIYNSEVTKGLANDSGLQQNRDKTPDELAEKIVPVMETNPRLLKYDICYSTTKSTSGDMEGFLPYLTNKRFVLTGLYVGFIKNAACDIATGTMSVRGVLAETNAGVDLLKIPVITTTAQEQNITITFKDPIILKENSNFFVTGTFAAGVLVRSCSVYGYWIDLRD